MVGKEYSYLNVTEVVPIHPMPKGKGILGTNYKPIIHLFENHIQYGDLQIGYNQFKNKEDDEFLPKNLKEMNEQIKKDLEKEGEDLPIC